MIGFLSSNQVLAFIALAGIILIIGYVILTVFEAIVYDDFDPVCEQKCKKCICYGHCPNHGCLYDCPDYMTEEILREKGISK